MRALRLLLVEKERRLVVQRTRMEYLRLNLQLVGGLGVLRLELFSAEVL